MKSYNFQFKYILYLMVAALLAAGVYFIVALKSDGVKEPVSVYIPEGVGYAGLQDSLERSGGITNMRKFRWAAKISGLDKGVRAGKYDLKPGQNYGDIAKMFRRGLHKPVNVTFNNVRTLPQLAGRLSGQLEPDSAAFAQYFLLDSVAESYGFGKRTFIAMFIPNTYELYWNTTPEGFVNRMSREYEKFWNENRIDRLDEIGLNRLQVITLASVVYEETKKTDEMPVVAGVYMNRLKKGMPLQADPTVIYAHNDYTIRRVLNSHLTIDSPYNTYKCSGLPPGPICMPSIAAIDAVLNYDHNNYLYFCARPDFSGYHSFAVTLAEHNRNSKAYQRALNALNIRN